MMIPFQTFIKLATTVCLLAAGTACSNQQVSEAGLTVTDLYGSNHCSLNEPVFRTIDSQAELRQLLQSMPKHFGQQEVVVPEINFEEKIVILYGLGQKPSSGYRIDLLAPEARLEHDILYLPLSEISPASGSGQAQIITSPCQIFVLPHVAYSEMMIENAPGD